MAKSIHTLFMTGMFLAVSGQAQAAFICKSTTPLESPVELKVNHEAYGQANVLYRSAGIEVPMVGEYERAQSDLRIQFDYDLESTNGAPARLEVITMVSTGPIRCSPRAGCGPSKITTQTEARLNFEGQAVRFDCHTDFGN